jgi:hypothetical protein
MSFNFYAKRKNIVFTLCLCVLFSIPFILHGTNSDYEKFNANFIDKTMRLDYIHSGNSTEEHFAVDRIVSDGIWAGSKTFLIDDLNLGYYRFDIFDKESGALLFSQGFASVYGEWESTADAKKQWGAFHESIRFPWPIKPVKIILNKRDAANKFVEKWVTEVDPKFHVNPADIIHSNTIVPILENGPAEKKVDIVILGDGYTKNEMSKFRNDSQRLVNAFFSVDPFKSRKSDFNVRAVETPSPVSGVTRPNFDIYKRTPLSVQYSSFDSERYALSFANKDIRDAASAVPYDFTFILINEQNYGGGGIYNTYATVAVDTVFSDYISIHEFGHHFAALADEYYTSQISYELDSKISIEPWEFNITALLDKDHLKWKDLVKPGTPIPTPWDKEEFDAYSLSIQKERQKLRDSRAKEEDMNALLLGEKKKELEMASRMKYVNEVGAFEGASYYSKGMFRPSVDCIMFTRNINFCPVCRRGLSLVIDRYTN